MSGGKFVVSRSTSAANPSGSGANPLERAIGLWAGACGLLTLAAFGFSSVLVHRSDAIDRFAIVWLRRQVDHPGTGWTTLREVMLLATALGSFPSLAVLTLGACVVLALKRRRVPAVWLFAATASGTAAANLLKEAVGRARPTLVPHWIEVSSLSFPSGHTADASVVFASFAIVAWRAPWGRSVRCLTASAGFGLAIMIGISRVYLGVHWPTDVLSGWSFGAAWAFLLAHRLPPTDFVHPAPNDALLDPGQP